MVDPNTITATFNITAGAGSRTIGVNTPAGAGTGTVVFTITSPPVATVSSISPTSGARNTANLPVTITGTNFTAFGTNLRGLGNNGLTATGVTVVNSTTITATFHITATAGLTTRNIGVTTPAGNSSNTTPFTVTP